MLSCAFDLCSPTRREKFWPFRSLSFSGAEAAIAGEFSPLFAKTSVL